MTIEEQVYPSTRDTEIARVIWISRRDFRTILRQVLPEVMRLFDWSGDNAFVAVFVAGARADRHQGLAGRFEPRNDAQAPDCVHRRYRVEEGPE